MILKEAKISKPILFVIYVLVRRFIKKKKKFEEYSVTISIIFFRSTIAFNIFWLSHSFIIY